MLPFKVSSLYEPLNLVFAASQKAKPEASTSWFFFFFFFLPSCSHFLGHCLASNWLVKFNPSLKAQLTCHVSLWLEFTSVSSALLAWPFHSLLFLGQQA